MYSLIVRGWQWSNQASLRYDNSHRHDILVTGDIGERSKGYEKY